MLGRRLMALGAVLILCALGLTAYNHWDDRRAQREAARLLEELKAAEPAESGEETLPLDGAEWLGWLRIPSLELELPVQAEWSYPALKTSPCRYAGTPEAGLVIAAHNYEQHFARLSLLTAGFAASFEFGGAAAAAGPAGLFGRGVVVLLAARLKVLFQHTEAALDVRLRAALRQQGQRFAEHPGVVLGVAAVQGKARLGGQVQHLPPAAGVGAALHKALGPQLFHQLGHRRPGDAPIQRKLGGGFAVVLNDVFQGVHLGGGVKPAGAVIRGQVGGQVKLGRLMQNVRLFGDGELFHGVLSGLVRPVPSSAEGGKLLNNSIPHPVAVDKSWKRGYNQLKS